MATFTELKALQENSGLRNKVEVALEIEAKNISETDPVDIPRSKFANEVVSNPNVWANRTFLLFLATNSTETSGDILNRSEANIQSDVAGFIDSLVAGFNG